MALNKEFFDNLDQLNKYKDNPGLKDFFDAANELEKISEDIKGERAELSADKSVLGKKAQGLTTRLEQRKDELARRTKTQKEYDAVYECIDYLSGHFNTRK